MCNHEEDCEVYGQRLEEYRSTAEWLLDNLLDRIINTEVSCRLKEARINELNQQIDMYKMEEAMR